MAIIDMIYLGGDLPYSRKVVDTVRKKDILCRHLSTLEQLAQDLLDHQARIFAVEGRIRPEKERKLDADGGVFAANMIGRAANDWGWVPEIYFVTKENRYAHVAERTETLHYINKTEVSADETARLLIRKLKLLRKRM